MAVLVGSGQHTFFALKTLVNLEKCVKRCLFSSWTASRSLYHIIHRPVLQIRLVIRSTQMKEIHPPQVPWICCYCQRVHKRQLSLDEPVSCWRAGAANLPGGTCRRLKLCCQTQNAIAALSFAVLLSGHRAIISPWLCSSRGSSDGHTEPCRCSGGLPQGGDGAAGSVDRSSVAWTQTWSPNIFWEKVKSD